MVVKDLSSEGGWLRNCPFCDASMDTKKMHFEEKNGKAALVCPQCGMVGPRRELDPSNKVPEIEAIQYWNQRGVILTKEDGKNIYKELKKNWEKGHHGDFFLSNGHDVEVVESALQHMWVRIGYVFHGKKKDKEDGIWIDTQPIYMHSSLDHTWLLSKPTWDKLNKFVQKEFKLIESWKKKN